MTISIKTSTTTSKPAGVSKVGTSILSVNPLTYAELTDLRNGGKTLRFDLTFSLSLLDYKVLQYEKVEVTVKRPTDFDSSAKDVKRGVKSTTNSPSKKTVAEKLYSGINSSFDASQTEKFAYKTSTVVSDDVKDALSSHHYVAELRQGQTIKFFPEKSKIDRFNLVQSVNDLGIDPSEVATRDWTKIGRRAAFLKDIESFFLRTVPARVAYDNVLRYDRVPKRPTYVDVTVPVYVDSSDRSSIMTIRFDLINSKTNKIDETVSVQLDVSGHVEAYGQLRDDPMITAQRVAAPSSRTSHERYVVSISEKNKTSGVKKYAVYTKGIDRFGSTTGYSLYGTFEKTHDIVEVVIDPKYRVEVVRVVPIDAQNRLSHRFGSVVLGHGHEDIGNVVSIVSTTGNSVRLEVKNIPETCSIVTIMKRDCTISPEIHFSRVHSERSSGADSYTYVDRDVLAGRTYEYYVSCQCHSKTTPEFVINSNSVMYRHRTSALSREGTKPIDVALTSPTTSLDSQGAPRVSFSLSTTTTQGENEKITTILKETLGELYNQYLNPANNPSSPLGSQVYRDIFFHEVVRTNLSTGERETFDPVGDGQFVDDETSRRKSNISPLNPQHRYLYQVHTFRKNPIELFKGYVARGLTRSGAEWFFSPYKWRNSQAIQGQLYGEDEDGPVIEAWESFTSESYGVTNSYTSNGSTEFTSVSSITVVRLDVNTIRLSWTIPKGSAPLYDSFVVMKVVNGVRSFVGRTHTTRFYHELTEKDVGNVHYIVCPIMSEFDIDDPAYSSTITVTPTGIIKQTKAPSGSVATPTKVPQQNL
jgi:hypothetical protein